MPLPSLSFPRLPLGSFLSSLLSLFHLLSPLPSPVPSVYPIWLSPLSWELSHRTPLLIQFLLNLMAWRSAFAIPASCGETKPPWKKREAEEQRQWSTKTWVDPSQKCPWTTKINSKATFQNVRSSFLRTGLLSGGRTKYMYKVTSYFRWRSKRGNLSWYVNLAKENIWLRSPNGRRKLCKMIDKKMAKIILQYYKQLIFLPV